jgi:glutathione S-transferase
MSGQREDPTLVYFDMRGRVEASRLLLVDQSIPFFDHRISEMDEWQALKPRTPFGYLPLYREGRTELSQRHAILRYLAKAHGLYPQSTSKQAASDEAHEALAEAQEALWRFAWHEDYQRDSEPYAAGALSSQLETLEASFLRYAGDYWLDEFSHIDCLAFVLLDEIRAFFPSTLVRFEHLAEFRESFQTRPLIRDYIDTRRPAVFGMGLHGPKVDPDTQVEAGCVFKNPWTEPILLT